jgi:DNA-binding MarR family transcriptional regulator
MSVRVSGARQVTEAVEQLLLALVRHRRGRNSEPGWLSTFESITLSAVADGGPLRLGTLAEALGTTDATACRTVDALEESQLVVRRPDPTDARCVIISATEGGIAEVHRRRRQLERLALHALEDLSSDEATRLARVLEELRALL